MALFNGLNKLKGYVGGTKLKAAYVGGTKVWVGSEIAYHAMLETLNIGGTAGTVADRYRIKMGVCNLTNKLFVSPGSGVNGQSSMIMIEKIDVFDNNLLNTVLWASPSNYRSYEASAIASTTNYALLANQDSTGGGSYKFTAFNDALVRTESGNVFTYYGNSRLSLSYNGYAIFAGGKREGANDSRDVDYFNNSLVKGTMSQIDNPKCSMRGNSFETIEFNGNAYFFGYAGMYTYDSKLNPEVYNPSLVKVASPVLNMTGTHKTSALAKVGDYLIVTNGITKFADIINKNNVVVSSIERFDQATANYEDCIRSGCSKGEFAVFMGGVNTSYKAIPYVEIFNPSLVKTVQSVPIGRGVAPAGTVGDYMLFMGGCWVVSSGQFKANSIDVFKVT